IEEPEAHLHPQLQNLFFEYMNQLKDKGIQLFITSHSPTITSKVELDSLLVLQKKDHAITNMAIRNSGLSGNNKKYLSKFLDVTKSQLFFANGVILVEGISEALLLPVIAKKAGYDLVKSGVEVVNIGGVAFEHFARLFNNSDQAKNLSAKCAIITDDDKKGNGDISDRAQKAQDEERQNLKVFLADVTFEKEIFDNNAALVKRVYGEMHPRTEINDVNVLLDKLKSNEDKSELSHKLAVQLSDCTQDFDNFVVPDYIRNAIRWVIG
ncbi:MAG TPA: TOPRIM nucleotidyl transferase/hydrolase domain-containing protein, partial [Desulfobacterales bacterium]|nr:TOPRIM nucleotidyl transferase/hydrolase domain-containing protein [Desulfobacterales bacterium]